MIKVSVIITIYNVEKYIDMCLKSITKQTLKDIEIICVNDGTTDNSMRIVNKYAKKDSRIKIINQKNSGQGKARNNGIKKAKGKYTYFIDSDDSLKPNALELLYNKLENDNLDTLFFDAESIYENDKLKKEKNIYDEYYKRKFDYSSVYTGQELFKEFDKNGEYRTSPCLQINKTSFLKDNNIVFLEGIIHEDEYFTLMVCLLAKRASHLKKSLYIRLVRPESVMTSSKGLQRSYGYIKTISEISDKILEYSTEDSIETFTNYLFKIQSSAIKYLRLSSNNVDKNKYLKDFNDYKNKLNNKEYIIFKLAIERNKNYINQVEQLKKQIKLQSGLKFWLKRAITSRTKKIKKFIKETFTNNINISIIIPVYNCENYLEECLNTILNQSMKEIEVICIDDESTDNSYNILLEYQNKDKRVKVFKQPHSNAGNARNLGIKNAKGKYLLFLDSDDIFEKDLCKKAYLNANKHHADILFFGAYKYDNLTGNRQVYNTLLNHKYAPINKEFSSNDVKEYLYFISSAAPWSKLFKKSFVKKNHLEFQPLPNSNDVYFTRISMALAKKMYAINEPLVNYRVNHGNNSQATKHKNPLAFTIAYKKVKQTLEEKNIYNKFYQTYLNVLINEIVYNYNSTKTDKAKKIILNYLKKEGLKELGIDNIDEELIIIPEKYEENKKIIG